MRLAIARIGLSAPGLPCWSQAQPVLCGQKPYAPTPLALDKPRRLAPNERRRTTDWVRLALRTAEQIAEGCPVPLEDLAMVFGSGGGDTHTIHQLCTVLLSREPALSPTQFHNSVHNAAAGYWSIASGAAGPSTALSAYDDTVGAALLEAAGLISEENVPVLCMVCDQRPLPPLLAKRPLTASFAAALLLLPAGETDATAALTLSPTDQPETRLDDAGLEALRRGNPAARMLGLLRALALARSATVVLPAPGKRLAVGVDPL